MKKLNYIFLPLILTACTMNNSSFQTSSLQTYAMRLSPGQDLKIELQKFIDEHEIKAACVLTCVGSLQKSTLRLANQSDYQSYGQKMEIVSLVGMLSTEGSHLHISLSDSTGTTIGGHLVDGCHVYTTAEIVLGIMPDYRFAREQDSASGYKELTVYPAQNK
jgi:predicted DNA-binding protein with PD1-like motif